jgi:hypothetical protein
MLFLDDTAHESLFGVGGSECLVVFCPDLIERISAILVVSLSLSLHVLAHRYTMTLIGVASRKLRYLAFASHVDSADART